MRVGTYTKKGIRKKFIDYLGPVNFNSMIYYTYLKKKIFNNVNNKTNYTSISIKTLIVN